MIHTRFAVKEMLQVKEILLNMWYGYLLISDYRVKYTVVDTLVMIDTSYNYLFFFTVIW